MPRHLGCALLLVFGSVYGFSHSYPLSKGAQWLTSKSAATIQ